MQDYANLKNKFKKLIDATCKAIERKELSVGDVVDTIRTALGARDKIFFMQNPLRKCECIPRVFDYLCCHWDYLHPDIYFSLIEDLSLDDVEQIKTDYQMKLNRFLDETLLSDFCLIPQVRKEKDEDPPDGFKECVTKHDWEPPPKRLREVDDLRKKLAYKCSLQSCAVTIADIKTGSIVITMLVPAGVELSVAADLDFMTEYNIIEMTFAGKLIYLKVSH